MSPRLHPHAYPLTIYFDGSCKLCRGEIENLLARDPAHRLIAIDCSPPAFDASGLPADRETLMNLIHARDAHGHWLRGVDVFIAAYRAAELDWVSRILRHPLLRPRADRLYPWLVRNRYLVSAIGLHRVLNVFTHRALRRQARAAVANSKGCINGACSLEKE